jgi:hypothetical protein
MTASTIWPFGAGKPSHPYYSLDPKFAAAYVPNETSPAELVGIISTAFAVVILGSWGALKLYKPQLHASERWIAVWFILCRHSIFSRVGVLTCPQAAFCTSLLKVPGP